MEEEIWKDIEITNGVYEISTYGNVRHIGGNNLKPQFKKGYPYIKLKINGKSKSFFIHRLVAIAFIYNPWNLPQVNHMDEDPSNPYVENLEWCMPKYNTNYGTGTQRRAKSLSIPVIQKDLFGSIIKIWDSMSEAERSGNGYRTGCISQCCRGIINIHADCRWEYEDKTHIPIKYNR